MARTTSSFAILLLLAQTARGPALAPSAGPGGAIQADPAAAQTGRFDVRGIEFRGVSAQKVDGLPTFVLRDVEDFQTLEADPGADMRLERVERREL